MAGKSFLRLGQAGIGTQTTTERTAGVSTATGTMTFDVTTNQLLVYSGNDSGWILAASTGTDATGGDATYTFGSKKIHAFTSSGSLVVTEELSSDIEIFAVGGGGGGANHSQGHSGGAGGAGGVVHGTIPASTFGTGTVTVTIGSGGPGGPPPGNQDGTQGGNTTIAGASLPTTITAKGGGHANAGGQGPAPGNPGGSGAGGSARNNSSGGSATQPGTNTPTYSGLMMLVLRVEHQNQETKVVIMPVGAAVVLVKLVVKVQVLTPTTKVVVADKELLFLQHSKILPTHMEEQDALVNHQLPEDSTLLAAEEEQVVLLHRLT